MPTIHFYAITCPLVHLALYMETYPKGFAHCRRPGPTERAPTEEFRSSEIPFFRIFDKIAETRFFKRVFKESLRRKCSRRACPTFAPKDFPLSFTRARFLPGITCFLADFKCRFRTRCRMFTFGWLAVAWECLERTLRVLGRSFSAVILWFHGVV